MPELKTYSVLIRWNDRDADEGEYGATVRAPTPDEAEAMTRALMRATGEGFYPFGSLVDCNEGATWAAADLEKALRALVQVAAFDDEHTEREDFDAAMKLADEALARCSPGVTAWGVLHFDGSPAPDWSRFAYLEIDGCQECHDGAEPYTSGRHTDDEAEFWTIYGREKETGMAQALQDCVSRAEADHVLAEMMRVSGLPGYRVGEEMPEAIKGVPFPHDRDDCDGEHSAALIEDDMATWQYEVANGGTRLGYDEWVAARKDAA